MKKEGESRRTSVGAASNPPAEVDPDTILKALFKSSGISASVQPTEFKIKLWGEEGKKWTGKLIEHGN